MLLADASLLSGSMKLPSMSWLPQCRACLRIGALDIVDGADPHEFVDLLADESLKGQDYGDVTQADFSTGFLVYFNECTRLQITQLQLQQELQGEANAAGSHQGRCHFLCGACKEVVEIAHQFISTARMSDSVIQKHLAAKNMGYGTINWTNECDCKETNISETTPSQENVFQMESGNSKIHDAMVQMIGVSPELYESEVVLIETSYEDCIDNEEENVDENQFLMEAREVAPNFNKETFEEGIYYDEHGNSVHNNAENDTDERSALQIERLDETQSATDYLDFSSSHDENDFDRVDVSPVALISVNPNAVIEQKKTRNRKRLKFLKFDCEFCCNNYKYQRELFEHYEKCHNETDANEHCKLCDKRFVTKSARNIHFRTVHELKEYRDCGQCGNTVLSTFYRQHLQRHHQRKHRYFCSICDTTFKTRNTLQKHLLTHSDSRERCNTCVECGKQFYSVNGLKIHQSTHHKEKDEHVSHTCSVCERVFARQGSLKLHMQLHRGVTMDCKECGKQFVRRKDLERHERFHSGICPYECSTCKRKFVMACHLKDHEQTHLGLRYKCTYCDKYFVNPVGLKQHYYMHTGMPFSCKVCKRGFATKVKVRRHLQGVHGALFMDSENIIDDFFSTEKCSNISLKCEYVAKIIVDGEEKDVETVSKDKLLAGATC